MKLAAGESTLSPSNEGGRPSSLYPFLDLSHGGWMLGGGVVVPELARRKPSVSSFPRICRHAWVEPASAAPHRPPRANFT
jgi:hypothetical protein